jgi:hypothetical protein
MNNLQDLSKEIDRHYEKKPHLMMLDIPPCTGCANGTCSVDEAAESGEKDGDE